MKFKMIHENYNVADLNRSMAFENPEMGIYFITDPDGYWLEILPARK